MRYSLFLFGALSAVLSVPSATRCSELDQAFEAVLEYETILNARDEFGEYITQTDGPDSLAERIAPVMTETFIGVGGLGASTDVFDYQPTAFGRADFANGMTNFQGLGALADELAGGDGTFDVVHEPFRGSVSGNMANFIMNFKALGSFTDADGKRLPVAIPHSLLLNPSATGSLVIAGRCICTCERVNGKWKFTNYYFVITPEELLYDVE